MSIDNELARTWLNLSAKKMFVATFCTLVLLWGWYVKDEIKQITQIAIVKFEGGSTFDPTKGIPTTVDKPSQGRIKAKMREFMRSHEDVNAMFMYQFVPKGQEMLYQGRIVVASESQNGKDLVKRYNVQWLPMNSDRKEMSKILRGDHYSRPSEISSTLSAGNSSTKFNMRLVEQDGTRYMLSIPISDTANQVRGYITVFLAVYPSPTELQYYTGTLSHEAVEFSRYLE